MIAILDGGNWRNLVHQAEADLVRNGLRLLWIELTQDKLHEAKGLGAKHVVLLKDYILAPVDSTTTLVIHYSALHKDHGWPSDYKDRIKSLLSLEKNIQIIVYTRDSYDSIRGYMASYKNISNTSFIAQQSPEQLVSILVTAHLKIPSEHVLPALQFILNEHIGRSDELRVSYLPMLLLRHYAKAEPDESDQHVLSRLLKNMRPSDLYFAVQHHFLR